MTLASYIFVMECVFVGGVSGFLVWHDGYEDSIPKRVALGLLLVVPCVIAVAEAIFAGMNGETSTALRVSPLIAWIGLGVSVFLYCHASKWWDYYRRGGSAWRQPGVARSGLEIPQPGPRVAD